MSPWGFNDCVVSSIEHLTYMMLYGLLHHYFEGLAIDRNDIDALDWSFYIVSVNGKTFKVMVK